MIGELRELGVNVLMLTGSFFMLEVYDRVLPSRSVPTLVALCILAFALFAAMGVDDQRSMRVSLSWSTTVADVSAFLDAAPEVLGSLRSLRAGT